MSMPHRLPDYTVRTDPWTLYCAACSQKMRPVRAIPVQDGRETRIYECACGHSESIDVAYVVTRNRTGGGFTNL
jgi:hypothetical protein